LEFWDKKATGFLVQGIIPRPGSACGKTTPPPKYRGGDKNKN